MGSRSGSSKCPHLNTQQTQTVAKLLRQTIYLEEEKVGSQSSVITK